MEHNFRLPTGYELTVSILGDVEGEGTRELQKSDLSGLGVSRNKALESEIVFRFPLYPQKEGTEDSSLSGLLPQRSIIETRLDFFSTSKNYYLLQVLFSISLIYM